MRPSFIISALSGTIIFIAIILFFINIKTISKDPKILTELLFLMGIGFAIHGISHYYEEIYFNFNPLTNDWKVNDKPIR
jgi:hypothetical protein